MEHDDKASICYKLRAIYQRLRQLEQDPEDTFIDASIPCNTNGGNLISIP